jgi:hypothetical protein
MRVTVTLALDIPDERVSVKSIEECVREAAGRFRSEAWQKWVWAVEEKARGEHPSGALRIKCWEGRSLWTTAGPVAFRRRRFLSREDGRSLLLFDMRVGLKPWQRTTMAADDLMSETAADIHGYQMAARSLDRTWGEGPSAMLVWQAVQRVARPLLERQEELRRAVFNDGDLPGWQRPAPDFLALEADSTYLPAWRGLGKDHEVHLGMGYTSKGQNGRRRWLQDKTLCVGLGDIQTFGRDFFVAMQERFNVTEVPSGLLTCDGDHRLRHMRLEHFHRMVGQLDWAHLGWKFDEAYGPERRERQKQLMGLLYAEKYRLACREVRNDLRQSRKRRAQLWDLATYLEGPGQDLYGARRLRRRGVRLPPHMQGSGGIERNIGILIARRMKRRGMGWTKRGASNLLAVRLRLFNHA